MRFVNASIQIQRPPAQVLESFVLYKHLKNWWGVETCLIDTATGGGYTLIWGISDKGIKYVTTGLVSEYKEDEFLYINNLYYINFEKPILGPFELRIDIEHTFEKGSNLFVSQGPYPENGNKDWEWYYQAVCNAWPGVLNTLKNYVEQLP